MSKILAFAFLVLLLSCTSNSPLEKTIDVEELTISKIHQSFENGEFTSQQLVEAYLSRIRQYDGPINSITMVNPDAMERAKQLDVEYADTGVLRPLHGIPMIVKDNINVAGLPTTAGSRALQNYVPNESAFIIQRLEDAGAIVLAKSNMAEWAFSPMHTESTTAGITHNPYNTDFVPAGSSGGTGASVAASFATFGLGTDTGNSIRGPSSHNALIGFRTTLGLISRSGIVPLYLRNDVVGPMCRTVEDATKVLQVMAGVDATDPITAYSSGQTPDHYTQFLLADGLNGARIGVLADLSQADPDPEIKTLFERAVNDLRSLGANVIDSVYIPNFAGLSANQWCAPFREDLESFLANEVQDENLTTLEDIIAIGSTSEFAQTRLERNAAHTGRWEDSEIPCGNAYEDELRIAFREGIEQVMDSLELDAFIYPTWNNKPARIDRFEEEYLGDNNQVISPHTGQPAFTVPMGFTSGNLPAGLQFLGRMYAEPTLITLAYAYEQGTQYRQPPELK